MPFTKIHNDYLHEVIGTLSGCGNLLPSQTVRRLPACPLRDRMGGLENLSVAAMLHQVEQL
ncbi:MAG: hypothetical protein P4N59_03495 [Negativicutes bacterium]|nr:hypothetical protein [Negativicutes bacterium]